jgi:hypothetical protein
MSGQGVELSLRTKNIDRQIKWTTNFIFSYAIDKVTDYKAQITGIKGYIETGSNPVEGKPVGALYSYRWAGLSSTTGDPQGYLNNAISKDYTAIGNSTNLTEMVYNGPINAPYYGSIRNVIECKGFSLYFNIGYQFGHYFRRSTVNYTSLFSGVNYGHKDYYNRWINPGDEAKTTVPSLIYPANSNRDRFYLYSEALVEKADNIRLRDIQLSYNYHGQWLNKKLGIRNIQVSLNANNLWILWKANKYGLDPDNPQNEIIADQPKKCTAGIRIDF